jgi:hypothetical protein
MVLKKERPMLRVPRGPPKTLGADFLIRSSPESKLCSKTPTARSRTHFPAVSPFLVWTRCEITSESNRMLLRCSIGFAVTTNQRLDVVREPAAQLAAGKPSVHFPFSRRGTKESELKL